MCALPSAQLGSMSSLNVPSYIPTVAVQKEPKVWERALLQLLTSAGSAAIRQGVQNAMQPDQAADFGEKPNTGLQSFIKGPKVDRAEAMRRRGDESATAREQFRLDSDNARLGQQEEAALRRLIEGNAQAEVMQGRQAGDAQRLEELRARNELGREDVRYGNEQALARLRSQLDQGDPYRAAGAKNLDAQTLLHTHQADRVKLQDEMTKDAMSPKGGKPAPGTSTRTTLPGLPKPGDTPPAAPAPQVNPLDRITQLVNAGTYTPDTIAALVKQDMIAPGAPPVIDSETLRKQKLIEELKQRLGLGVDPRYPQGARF